MEGEDVVVQPPAREGPGELPPVLSPSVTLAEVADTDTDDDTYLSSIRELRHQLTASLTLFSTSHFAN